MYSFYNRRMTKAVVHARTIAIVYVCRRSLEIMCRVIKVGGSESRSHRLTKEIGGLLTTVVHACCRITGWPCFWTFRCPHWQGQGWQGCERWQGCESYWQDRRCQTWKRRLRMHHQEDEAGLARPIVRLSVRPAIHPIEESVRPTVRPVLLRRKANIVLSWVLRHLPYSQPLQRKPQKRWRGRRPRHL